MSLNHKLSKRKARKRVPKSLKDKLWETTFGQHAGSGPCYVCGTTIFARKFEAGHVIAVANNGPTILSNLRCICSSCNKSMGDEHLEKFKLKYFQEKPVKQIITPCYLCGEETYGMGKYNVEFFKCCGKYVHCVRNNDSEFNCLYHYLDSAVNLCGRKIVFMRKTNCPSCLEPLFGVLKHYEK